MADNTTLNVGTAGDVIRSEDRAGVKTQVVGLDLGIGTGSEVLMAGAMPVTIAASVTVLPEWGSLWPMSQEIGTVYDGNQALTPKFAVISASASGNTPVVAAVVGRRIRVLRWSVSSNGAVNVKFQRATTDITGLYYLTQFAGVGGGYCPVGHFETGWAEALNINLSASVAVGGVCTYVEV